MATGVKHYLRDGSVHTGGTHKHADGTVMTGARMTQNSKRLYHFGDLSARAKKKARGNWNGKS
tara:strand:- start:259 stop:447 length:189 start_codon:yes stop_codon:yes gene_type:complete